MWVNRSKRSPSRGVHEQSSDPGWTARYKTTGQWLVCVGQTVRGAGVHGLSAKRLADRGVVRSAAGKVMRDRRRRGGMGSAWTRAPDLGV